MQPAIHRVTGKFMELPRDHVNAYIVELDHSVVIIDATLALSSAQALRDQAESLGKPIEAVLLTHGHPDHYTGLAKFTDLPRIASQECINFAHREDIVKAPVATMILGDDYPKTRTFPNELIKDGESRRFGNLTFTFHELGPGESDSDGMWVFEQDGIKHAFVGDVVAKGCHCFFRDGHIAAWFKLLDRFEREFSDADQLYIGHGNAPAGKETIHWQRGYNEAFLRAVRRLRQHPEPLGRAAQEQVINEMKDFMPTDATLFLLDYELNETFEHLLNSSDLV